VLPWRQSILVSNTYTPEYLLGRVKEIENWLKNATSL
jgi:hypothetical protein